MGLSDPRTLIQRDLAELLRQMGIRVNQTIRIAS